MLIHHTSHIYSPNQPLKPPGVPLKQSFLLLLQRRQVQTNMIRLRASRLAAVMAEVSGIGAEMMMI